MASATAESEGVLAPDSVFYGCSPFSRKDAQYYHSLFLERAKMENEIEGMKSFRHPTQRSLVALVIREGKTVILLDEFKFGQFLCESEGGKDPADPERVVRIAHSIDFESPQDIRGFVLNEFSRHTKASSTRCLLKIGDDTILAVKESDRPSYLHLDRYRSELTSEEHLRLFQLAVDICFPSKQICERVGPTFTSTVSIEDPAIKERIVADFAEPVVTREKQQAMRQFIRWFAHAVLEPRELPDFGDTPSFSVTSCSPGESDVWISIMACTM